MAFIPRKGQTRPESCAPLPCGPRAPQRGDAAGAGHGVVPWLQCPPMLPPQLDVSGMLLRPTVTDTPVMSSVRGSIQNQHPWP